MHTIISVLHKGDGKQTRHFITFRQSITKASGFYVASYCRPVSTAACHLRFLKMMIMLTDNIHLFKATISIDLCKTYFSCLDPFH